jgi:hypothetical protein
MSLEIQNTVMMVALDALSSKRFIPQARSVQYAHRLLDGRGCG